MSSDKLAWVLKSFEPRSLARALGWSAKEIEEIEGFRTWLIDRLVRAGAPE